MMSTFNHRRTLGIAPGKPRWYCDVLVTLGFALDVGRPVWAQEAAKPDGASGGSPLAWLILLLPSLIIIFFLIPVMKRQRRYSTQVNRSIEISEETLQLARERTALQKQTNELLRQLVEKQSRF
jgi:hypothetical protein